MNSSGIDDGKKRMMIAVGAGMVGLLILLAVLAEEEDEKNERPSSCSPGGMMQENHAFLSPGPIRPGAQPPTFAQAGRGKVWRQEYAHVRSARQAAAQALRKISAQLGQRVKPLGNAAVGDENDENFLMMFEGMEQGRPVQGVLRVSAADGVAYASAAWAAPGQDLSALLAQTLPAEKRPAGTGAPPPSPVRWQNIPLPDGTGSIRLPEGWRIASANTPQQGCISAEGPQGSIDLGYAMQLITPQAAAMSMLPLSDVHPVAAYSNPKQAIADVFQIMARIAQRSGQPGMRWGRVLDFEEAPATLGGQAAIVHFTWEKEHAGQWIPVESLAYVNMAPVGMESWMYYNSFVSAPAAAFRQNLKTLLEIWGSWKVSDRVHQSRLAKALQTQRETFDIQQQSYQYQQQVSDRVWKAWSETNLSQQAVLDRDRNEVRHLDLRWADDVVRKANELEGAERWIKVDPFQLDY